MFFTAFMSSCSNSNTAGGGDNPVSSGQESLSLQFETTTKSVLANDEIKNIDIDEAFDMLKDKNKYFLLDVRTPEEYKEGFIENSILIPLSELEGRLSEIPADKPIIVYCRSGNRSMQAAEILVKNNFNPVYNMLGGITEWIKEGYPLVKQ